MKDAKLLENVQRRAPSIYIFGAKLLENVQRRAPHIHIWGISDLLKMYTDLGSRTITIETKTF